jgi:fatty acid desaturase
MLKHSELLNAADRVRSDWRAWWLVMTNWAAIIALLVLAGLYPSMLTIPLLWVVLPGRQLGLSVLMHEAGHGSLFSTRRLNHWVGQWLCALPMLNDLPSYAAAHLKHHRLTGTPQDPDLANYRAYPVDSRSFRRKVIRDLTGQTGAKLVVGAVKGGLSHFSGQAASGDRLLSLKQVFVQATLALILMLLGIGWTWLLWFATLMTSYMLVTRLRQIAEHAAVPDANDPDPRMNTRTVIAPAWQRWLLAPHGVNFHLEHHLLPGVPCYHLPAFRTRLVEMGWLDRVPVFSGYPEVFAHAVRRG